MWNLSSEKQDKKTKVRHKYKKLPTEAKETNK